MRIHQLVEARDTVTVSKTWFGAHAGNSEIISRYHYGHVYRKPRVGVVVPEQAIAWLNGWNGPLSWRIRAKVTTYDGDLVLFTNNITDKRRVQELFEMADDPDRIWAEIGDPGIDW